MSASQTSIVLAVGLCLFTFGRSLSHWTDHSPRPKVQITPDLVDLGKVPVGHSISRTFLLRNVGNAQLLVADVKSTCQCTVAELSTRIIDPSQTIELVVTFKATSPGPKKQEVMVQSNDWETPTHILKLNAEAISATQ
jgi:hypothetical protein